MDKLETLPELGAINIVQYHSAVLPSCSNKVIEIKYDGTILWNGREIESDDEFKLAMLDVRAYIMQGKIR